MICMFYLRDNVVIKQSACETEYLIPDTLICTTEFPPCAVFLKKANFNFPVNRGLELSPMNGK